MKAQASNSSQVNMGSFIFVGQEKLLFFHRTRTVIGSTKYGKLLSIFTVGEAVRSTCRFGEEEERWKFGWQQ